MANEPTLIEAPRIVKRLTVADGTAIPYNTCLALSDPNTGTANTAGDVWGGITVEEKTLSDGIVNVAVALDGTWDMYAGGGTTITAGELVKLSGPNTIEGDVVEADIIAGKVVGKAKESVAIGTAERIRVDVGLI